MDSADSPKPARNAKAWIIIIAIVLMVTPFIVLALRKNPAPAPMVWIPGGEFTMGSDKADEKHAEEAPGHAVIVKGFWMDVTEVTNAQFQAFVDATKYITDAEKDLDPRQFPDAPPEMLKGGSLLFKKVSGVNPFQCGGANLPWWNFTAGANWRQPEGQNSSIKERMNHPVICLTYKDVQAYAKWAGKRLPTEAEWEFAARGGLKDKPYVWGDEERPSGKIMCNHWQGKFPERDNGVDGFTYVAPVKSFPANAYGLYDMAGNVWEMVGSAYRSYPYEASDGRENFDLPEEYVLRGGSFYSPHGRYLRTTARSMNYQFRRRDHIGFRVVQA